MCAAIRARGAVPAVTAVVRGIPTAGLDAPDLERFLARSRIPKVSARDLPWSMASGGDGATTVAASICLSARAGIDVFATGGIGGVHRSALGSPLDESADLLELSRTSVVTVCAGAKSILDLRATVERLETLGVTVVGFRTDEFPGFFTAHTGLPVGAVAESAGAIASAFRASRKLGRPGALLVVQPPPAAAALDGRLVEDAVSAALASAAHAGIAGAALTPFLLAEVERATGGRSLAANIALLEANAALAAEIAVALSDSG
jgi:pseudouridine-5'-phosphate glycosidase